MRQRRQISGSRVVATLAFGLLAGTSYAGQPTTDFDLLTAGSGNNLAGVYTSPYAARIGEGPLTSVICDDFADNTFRPEDWTAYVTPLSTIVPGPDPNGLELKWNGASVNTTVNGVTYNWSLSQAQAYTVAALLSIDIVQSNPTNCLLSSSCPEAATQEDYSFALWGLFDPTTAAGQANQNTPSGTTDDVVDWLNGHGDSIDLAKATADLNTAIGEVTSGQLNGGETVSAYLSGYNVQIYSYDPSFGTSCPAGSSCPPPPQEFITVTAAVAEPTSIATLIFYLLVGGGSLLFFGRSHISRVDS